MIDRDSHQLSIRRQCELVDVNRNRLTPPPDNPGAREIQLCRLIDEVVRVAGRAPEIFNTDQGCQFTSRAWPGTSHRSWYPHQHGRQGPMARQRVHRKVVENHQIRRTPPARVLPHYPNSKRS